MANLLQSSTAQQLSTGKDTESQYVHKQKPHDSIVCLLINGDNDNVYGHLPPSAQIFDSCASCKINFKHIVKANEASASSNKKLNNHQNLLFLPEKCKSPIFF